MLRTSKLLVYLGVGLLLLVVLAQLDTSCSCTGFGSCFDSSLATCRVDFLAGLLGPGIARVAATDAASLVVMLLGVGLLVMGAASPEIRSGNARIA